MKEYDVLKYWGKRENPCSTSIDDLTPTHLKFLSKHVIDCKKVLDYGPGYGRLFSCYESGTSVTGVDVTPQFNNELHKEAKKYNLDFALYCKDVLSPFIFNDKSFDAAIASEVLFHQTPITIEKIMHELLRVSNKVIVITYMNLLTKYDKIEKEFDKSKYCFNYDYYSIAKKNKWKIENEERIKNQIMFTYTEE
jgi:ubiquinone/menaquinone biosynthesis C-methylase UbiE